MDQRITIADRLGCRVTCRMDQAIDQTIAVTASRRRTDRTPGVDGCPMRNVNLESDRGHNLICGSLHAFDISVGKSTDSVARVVARECLSQPDLHVATRISGEIIVDK